MYCVFFSAEKKKKATAFTIKLFFLERENPMKNKVCSVIQVT